MIPETWVLTPYERTYCCVLGASSSEGMGGTDWRGENSPAGKGIESLELLNAVMSAFLDVKGIRTTTDGEEAELHQAGWRAWLALGGDA